MSYYFENFMINEEYFWAGIILIIVTMGILHIYYTPTDKHDILSVHNSCTASIGFFDQEINVGSPIQKLLGAEDACRNAYYNSLVLNYGWLGYFFGAILIIASFLIKEKESL